MQSVRARDSNLSAFPVAQNEGMTMLVMIKLKDNIREHHINWNDTLDIRGEVTNMSSFVGQVSAGTRK